MPYLLLGIFFCLTTASLIASVAGFNPVALRTGSLRFLVFLLSSFFFQGTTLLLVFIFLRDSQVSWTEAFGFRNRNLRRCVLLALGALVGFLPVAWTLSHVTGLLIEKSGQKPVVQQAVQLIQEHPPLYETLCMGISTILLAPVVEEILFRGILYPTLKQMQFPRFALYGTSLLFAAIHSNLLTFLPLFILAIILTLLYEATDNLLAPIALHSFFNAANFGLLLGQNHFEQWWKAFLHLFK